MTKVWLGPGRIQNNQTGETVLLITYGDGTPVDWPAIEPTPRDERVSTFAHRLVDAMNESEALA